MTVSTYLNENLREIWIVSGGDEDGFLMKLLLLSPVLSPCDFFLWDM